MNGNKQNFPFGKDIKSAILLYEIIENESNITKTRVYSLLTEYEFGLRELRKLKNIKNTIYLLWRNDFIKRINELKIISNKEKDILHYTENIVRTKYRQFLRGEKI
jgi:hypothetical protein